ncbi:unnamed protein product [Tenebrio molitor]|nr:unnamed protein product [Tenebrio molitor]
MKTLLPTMAKNNHYILQSVNKIYVKKDLTTKRDFCNLAHQIYQAEVENIDFSKPDHAVSLINEWVKEHTENKIVNLLSVGKVKPDAKMVLVNALHFKSGWVIPFKKEHTIRANFHKNDHEVIKVDMMTSEGRFYYYESVDLEAKFLKMYLEGNAASVVVALPDEKDGLEALGKKIENICVHPKFTLEQVQVSLPKFKIETTKDFVPIMRNFEVNKPFARGADFSGIGIHEDLYINAIMQKTCIDLNEKGLEDAVGAKTGVAEEEEAAGQRFAFVADHPFAFYLQTDDVILFVGKVSSPAY